MVCCYGIINNYGIYNIMISNIMISNIMISNIMISNIMIMQCSTLLIFTPAVKSLLISPACKSS